MHSSKQHETIRMMLFFFFFLLSGLQRKQLLKTHIPFRIRQGRRFNLNLGEKRKWKKCNRKISNEKRKK